jgi:hypothetical protein
MVLVIGTDGTRWDRVQAVIRAGRAPNIRPAPARRFGVTSRLDYGPGTLTISEVGWSSIASGVWENKHGINGTKRNKDPGQATKNGYLDFLTKLEQGRPSLSTFIASDWDNIALPLNGGPIFGTAMDARLAVRVTTESLAAWDAGDEAVTRGPRATCAAAIRTPGSCTSGSSTRAPIWPARRHRPTRAPSPRQTAGSAGSWRRSARAAELSLRELDDPRHDRPRASAR